MQKMTHGSFRRFISGALQAQMTILSIIIGQFLLLNGINRVNPEIFPVDFNYLWQVRGPWWMIPLVIIPVLAGLGYSTWWSLKRTNNHPNLNYYAEDLVRGGTVVSLLAGIFEEIEFRWLLPYTLMISLSELNILLGGSIAGIFQNFLLPVANFLSFGLMHEWLLRPDWVVGAAIVLSNWKFQTGHAYQGPGCIIHWFTGMFFFILTWSLFGLPVAIPTHFLWDGMLFTLYYLDAKKERQDGHSMSDEQVANLALRGIKERVAYFALNFVNPRLQKQFAKELYACILEMLNGTK